MRSPSRWVHRQREFGHVPPRLARTRRLLGDPGRVLSVVYPSVTATEFPRPARAGHWPTEPATFRLTIRGLGARPLPSQLRARDSRSPWRPAPGGHPPAKRRLGAPFRPVNTRHLGSADAKQPCHPFVHGPTSGDVTRGHLWPGRRAGGPARSRQGPSGAAATRSGSRPTQAPTYQEAGFSTMDSKRIAPVTLSRRRKRKGWSTTIGCSGNGVAVAMTSIRVAAAAVVPFGVTWR